MARLAPAHLTHGPGRPCRAPAPPARRRRLRPGPSDADQAALVPSPARFVSAGPLDEVPAMLRYVVQQAAREGGPHLPDVRPPLPALGRGAAGDAPRSRHVPGA